MLTLLVVILFLPFAHLSKSKKFIRSSLSIHKIVKQDEIMDCKIELNEIESLSIGWPRDIARVGLACLLFLLFAARVWDFYSLNKQLQWNDRFSDAVVDGFCLTAFWNIVPLLGWTPWQWGAVTIDVQSLRIPRIRKTVVFRRGPNIRIKVVRGVAGHSIIAR